MRSVWVAAALAALAVEARAQGEAAVGSRPKYDFREALVNGRGVKSLADLQGRPTLVEFWGTR